MADTRSHHSTPIPVEEDGISYRGLVWFAVVLTIITLVCQALMFGLFWVMERRAIGTDVQRAPLAAPPLQQPPGPTLLTDEPSNLRTFRQAEEAALTTYGWVDKNAGTMRIPIDRAKELLLERGLPVRGQTPPPAAGTTPVQGKKQ